MLVIDIKKMQKNVLEMYNKTPHALQKKICQKVQSDKATHGLAQCSCSEGARGVIKNFKKR